MARALSNANLIASLSETITLLINRRGYSAAAGVVTGTGSMMRSVEEKAVTRKRSEGALDSNKSSWVPDPITGYYRPGDRNGEIDAAELREMLLSHKSRD